MPRFFISPPGIDRGDIVIQGREARHVQRVLRLTVGDTVDLFDGTGKEYHGRIVCRDRHTVTVKILRIRMPDREAPLALIMGQSLIKGNKMDFIVQKATEMGVSDFIPFVSSRSVIRLKDDRLEHSLNRWRKIALESAKQCARVIPMRIETVLRFEQALRQTPHGTERLFLWERSKTKLKSLLQKRGKPPGAPQGVYFLVGPEGGFSEEEARQAEAAHFVSVRLGPRTLRADTVGLTFVSILQYEWGDLG